VRSVLSHQAQQLPQGKRDHLAAVLLQPRDRIGQFRRRGYDRFLFRMGIGAWRLLTTRWPVLSQHHSLVGGFGNAAVRDHTACVQLDLNLVLGLSHLHAAAHPVQWNRIVVGVQYNVTFDIHQALMQPVDLRNPGRQRFQTQTLHREQLARNRADMFFIG
jgi:hypothetical protein